MSVHSAHSSFARLHHHFTPGSGLMTPVPKRTTGRRRSARAGKWRARRPIELYDADTVTHRRRSLTTLLRKTPGNTLSFAFKRPVPVCRLPPFTVRSPLSSRGEPLQLWEDVAPGPPLGMGVGSFSAYCSSWHVHLWCRRYDRDQPRRDRYHQSDNRAVPTNPAAANPDRVL